MIAGIRWTNDSVRRFAGETDPVDAITDRARTVVTEAMDAGWTGPLLTRWALPTSFASRIVPSADVLDARTVPVGEASARIEYNPTARADECGTRRHMRLPTHSSPTAESGLEIAPPMKA